MRIRLRLDGRHLRRWHETLVRAITVDPARVVEVDARAGPGGWPANADWLFRFEALIDRLPRSGPSASLDRRPAMWPAPGRDTPDLILDLCGDVPDAPNVPVWRLTYENLPGEPGLLASLLAGRVPVARLHDGAVLRGAGRPGTERHGSVLTAFEDALARSVTLILAALDGESPMLDAKTDPLSLPQLTTPELAARLSRKLAGAVVRHLYRLCFRAPHWRVGWRRLDGPDLIDLRAHPQAGWHRLPDDGLRFYADPFPIAHRGERVLFVEEYPHRLGKALISAVRLGPDGPVGTPEPVLEEGHHLSYPFVFEAEGAVWMVPEACENGTVDLYRATAFPRGWIKEATLLSGLAASDATLLNRGGRWWLFATVRHADARAPLGEGSYSDALHLWSARNFRGPWTPHARNPVLIDVASARPAGRIVSRGGKLIRPVQDCSLGYGHRLGLARIDRLDDGGFSQSVETVLGAGPAWPGSRLHTLNAGAGFEFIDGSARAPRFMPRLKRLEDREKSRFPNPLPHPEVPA